MPAGVAPSDEFELNQQSRRAYYSFLGSVFDHIYSICIRSFIDLLPSLLKLFLRVGPNGCQLRQQRQISYTVGFMNKMAYLYH